MEKNPCNIFDRLIKATLNCLGYNHGNSSSFVSTYSHRGEEELRSTEVIGYIKTRFITLTTEARGRRPPRPPVQSGGGGQTNSSSY